MELSPHCNTYTTELSHSFNPCLALYLRGYLRLDKSFPNNFTAPKRKDVCENSRESSEMHASLGNTAPLLGTNCVHLYVHGYENLHIPNLIKGGFGNIIQVHLTPEAQQFWARTCKETTHVRYTILKAETLRTNKIPCSTLVEGVMVESVGF